MRIIRTLKAHRGEGWTCQESPQNWGLDVGDTCVLVAFPSQYLTGKNTVKNQQIQKLGRDTLQPNTNLT